MLLGLLTMLMLLASAAGSPANAADAELGCADLSSASGPASALSLSWAAPLCLDPTQNAAQSCHAVAFRNMVAGKGKKAQQAGDSSSRLKLQLC